MPAICSSCGNRLKDRSVGVDRRKIEHGSARRPSLYREKFVETRLVSYALVVIAEVALPIAETLLEHAVIAADGDIGIYAYQSRTRHEIKPLGVVVWINTTTPTCARPS